ALGLLVALWGVGVAKTSLPERVARAGLIGINARVFVVTIVSALATGALFGAVPAWLASRTDVVGLLKETAMGSWAPRRWRLAFLVTQIGFVTALLVASALFVSSFIRVTRVDLGFERGHLLASGFVSGTAATIADTAEALRKTPGVVSVALVSGSSPPLVASGYGGGSSGPPPHRPDTPQTPPPNPQTR